MTLDEIGTYVGSPATEFEFTIGNPDGFLQLITPDMLVVDRDARVVMAKLTDEHIAGLSGIRHEGFAETQEEIDAGTAR